MQRLYRKGKKFGDWTLTSFKGGGGNGEVWACVNSAKDDYFTEADPPVSL